MKILIVEDEAIVAKRINRLCNEIFTGQPCNITILPNLGQAINYVQSHSIDVLTLDLNLNGKDGFELLKTLVAGSFHTIIISAYKERAIEAFEYGVIDFVSKPFGKDRLEKAFQRILKHESNNFNTTKYLSIKKQGKIDIIEIDNIIYIKGARTYSELYFNDGNKELHDKSLDKLHAILPNTFIRTHKSYIVKLTEIESLKVQTGSKYELCLKGGFTLPVGRTRYKELKKKFG